MRDNRETQAKQILAQREEREERKKEKEKLQKEADRKLKEEFDKAKTEAVLLGMPQGQAMSMSLGSLKGWVSATRERKVNDENMRKTQMEFERHKMQMEQHQANMTKQKSMDKGAEMALRNRGSAKNAAKPIFKNIDQLMGYQNTQQQMRQSGPLRVDQVMPGGNAKAPPVNIMQGGGFKPQIMKQPEPTHPMPKLFNAQDPNNPNAKPNAMVTAGGAVRPTSDFNTGGVDYEQFDPSKDTYKMNPDGTRTLEKAGVSSSTGTGVYSQERVDQLLRMQSQLMQELNDGPPDNLSTPSEKDRWFDRKRTLLMETNDQIDKVKRTQPNQGQPQTQPSQAVDPDATLNREQMFQKYFTNGQPNSEFIAVAQKGKQAKVKLLRSMMDKGVITEEQAIELLKF
jgi:hypothetical protein